MHRMLMSPLALIGLIIMSGCGLLTNERVVVKTVTEYVYESPTWQYCIGRPTPPKPDAKGIITAADARAYEADLHAWGEDCESKVNGGRLEAEQRQKEVANEVR